MRRSQFRTPLARPVTLSKLLTLLSLKILVVVIVTMAVISALAWSVVVKQKTSGEGSVHRLLIGEYVYHARELRLLQDASRLGGADYLDLLVENRMAKCREAMAALGANERVREDYRWGEVEAAFQDYARAAAAAGPGPGAESEPVEYR